MRPPGLVKSNWAGADETLEMNFPRRDRRLFLTLAILAAAAAIAGRIMTGSWPPMEYWVPPLVLGLFGAQLGRPWRRPVSRTQLEEYEKWRAETELSKDEQAARLSGPLGAPFGVPEPSIVRPRQARRTFQQRRREFAASVGRPFFVKEAIGFTIATGVLVSVLPYAIARGDLGLSILGAVLFLFAPLTGYVAFTGWWYVRYGDFFEPPVWLSHFGRRLLDGLYRDLGRGW